MKNLSQMQLIELWSQLEQAYFGKNKYAGHTAEIYAYTVMPYSPTLEAAEKPFPTSIIQEQAREIHAAAWKSMIEVLSLFAKKRDCKILIENTPLSKYPKNIEFWNRVHVEVIPKS